MDSYEFSESHNLVLSDLVKVLKGFGNTVFLGAALYSMVLVTQFLKPLAESDQFTPLVIASVIGCLVVMGLGVLTLFAGNSFQSVAETEGGDVGHLFDGIRRYSLFFRTLSATLWVMSLVLLGVLGQAMLGG